MIDRFRRETALAACPNLSCRRRRTCKGMAHDRQCLKTHFATGDDWRNHLVAKLQRLYVERGGSPEDLRKPPKEDPEGVARLYNALKKRAAEHDAEMAAARGHRNVH